MALPGVRQCTKTTLLQTWPAGWKRVDLERRADHTVVSRDPDAFFRVNPRHLALDEAQVLPDVFPALRVAIDERRAEKGRFVITGSSSPALLQSVSESLVGRVGIIEMASIPCEGVRRRLAALGVAHDYAHYRTGAGAELDLVVEGHFGRVAVEIKHTSTVSGRDLRSVRDFVTEHKARLGVVINNDVMARRYDEDVIGLPFTWL